LDFSQKMLGAWESSGAGLCVGLDPIIERIPDSIARSPRPVLAFNRHVIDIVGDLVCAFKPQHAHHAAVAAENDLAETVAYIHVTVNPYLGDDGVLPFLERPDRAAVVLCRTSNPSAALVQNAQIDGSTLFETIARRAEGTWNRLGNVMLVVGATNIDDLATVRRAAPTLPFLAPGIGEQGGSPRAVMDAGRRADGRGIIASASRSVLYAGSEAQIRAAAEAIYRDLAD